MSNAVAAEAPVPAPKGSKKKLIIIAAAAVLVLALAATAALLLLKKKPADEEDAEGGEAAAAQVEPESPKSKKDPKAVPVFVPLEPFTVNLADREAERYAQVSVTLEVADSNAAEKVKAFLPAVRNNILMVLAHMTSAQMLEREGKVQLAEEIRRETSRALGIDPDGDAEPAPKKGPKKKAKPKKEPLVLPVTAVHFSNFIVQ